LLSNHQAIISRLAPVLEQELQLQAQQMVAAQHKQLAQEFLQP
jgi:LPS sulfotransferase NodH